MGNGGAWLLSVNDVHRTYGEANGWAAHPAWKWNAPSRPSGLASASASSIQYYQLLISGYLPVND
jgi:hypothetical protein